ncbi:hypothetical protein [Arthrobacter sp. NPDC056493]|uniref:hypothetical protein n=1 Tax=Arthrobacter sp. NPDC056493 TaxID=3345839 RepID=UPI00366FD8DE
MNDATAGAETVRAPAPGMLEVTITKGADVEQTLAGAIKKISPAAKFHGTGIVITRITDDHYIVRAHTSVPAGLVRHCNF